MVPPKRRTVHVSGRVLQKPAFSLFGCVKTTCIFQKRREPSPRVPGRHLETPSGGLRAISAPPSASGRWVAQPRVPRHEVAQAPDTPPRFYVYELRNTRKKRRRRNKKSRVAKKKKKRQGFCTEKPGFARCPFCVRGFAVLVRENTVPVFLLFFSCQKQFFRGKAEKDRLFGSDPLLSRFG